MLDHARASGDRLMEIRGLPALAEMALSGPLPVPEALRRCEELLVRSEGDRRAQAVINRSIAHLLAMSGDFQAARDLYRSVRRTLEELGWRFTAALVSLDSGPIELLAGDPKAAEAELRSAYEQLDEMGERNYISTTAAILAEALFQQGKYDESSELATFAETVAAEDDLLTQFLWRGTRSRLLARTGTSEAAAAMAREAVRLAHISDDPTSQGNALVTLAEVQSQTGQANEAAASLSAAVTRFEAKGNVAAAASARRHLASLGAEVAVEGELMDQLRGIGRIG
jgi:ATP/maltotriose-dependent transcriptional regulator MalT